VLIRIDASSDISIFEQVAAAIRTDMAAGRVRPDDKLPSAREVAASLGVNLHTVLRAYQDLRDEGLLELRRGRGAVVAATRDRTELQAAINSLVRTARSLGVPPATTISLVKEALR